MARARTEQAPDGELSSEIPTPKRYAHHGKRRRKYTREMVRCLHVDHVRGASLVCNALLWVHKPIDLKRHLLNHLPADQIVKMGDSQVRAWYTKARKIYLEGVSDELDDEAEIESED